MFGRFSLLRAVSVLGIALADVRDALLALVAMNNAFIATLTSEERALLRTNPRLVALQDRAARRDLSRRSIEALREPLEEYIEALNRFGHRAASVAGAAGKVEAMIAFEVGADLLCDVIHEALFDTDAALDLAEGDQAAFEALQQRLRPYFEAAQARIESERTHAAAVMERLQSETRH